LALKNQNAQDFKYLDKDDHMLIWLFTR